MNNSQAAAKRRLEALRQGAAPHETSNYTGQSYFVDDAGNVSQAAAQTTLIPRGTLTFTIKKETGASIATAIPVSLFRGIDKNANADLEIKMQESPYGDLLEQSKA